MSSLALRTLSVAGLVAFAAACSGDVTAPQATQPHDGPALAKGGVPGGPAKNGVTAVRLVIDPTQTKVYEIGNNAWVYIPAGSVCTLDTPYGMSEWDNECERATAPIVVDAVVQTTAGESSANFWPDLRFAPAAEGDYMNWVFLGLRMSKKLDTENGYGILYRPTGSLELIDEAATDPTLRAFRWSGQTVVRRLKHFSGYNVTLGYDEQDADPFGNVLEGM